LTTLFDTGSGNQGGGVGQSHAASAGRLMRSQLHHIVAEASARCPAAPALTYKDATLTYREVWDRSVAFGAGLQRLGLGRGERVAVYLEKRIETVVSVFGASVAGGVFVPVNPLLRSSQVSHIVNDCSARILITSSERFDQLEEELAECKSLDRVVVVGESHRGRPGARYEITDWDGVASPDAAAHDVGGVDLDMAAILYTSGSTGRPKGVVLSHRNLIVGAESVSEYLANDEHDVILGALPLSFDAGFSQVTTGFSAGAHVVLMNYLLPGDVVRLCAKHGVTGLTCVPPLWIQLVDHKWTPEASRSLRYFANTGGRMPRATLDRLRAIFPQATPFLMYGLTEAFRSTYLDPAEVDRRPDSIGKAIPNAEILIVRDDGSLCDPGQEGELVHRGSLVAMGYWNDAERTAERFRPAPNREDGVCTTELAVFSGDVVKRDEEGFLYFVSRKDEMIKTSGYRVSPTEIEEVVYGTGLVRDAVAIGVDDERLGQAVMLVVSCKPSAELEPAALLDELRRQLPLYMVPKEIVVRRDLPRSPNGKFDRKLLRQELTA
jgi:acyl-CoA ligase (AMP-forming) (exosortase A-associated)